MKTLNRKQVSGKPPRAPSSAFVSFIRGSVGIIALSLLLYFFTGTVHAQPTPPPPADRYLDSWSFSTTDWLSDLGYAPVAFTNLILVTNQGGALLLDTTTEIPAYLAYNVVENDGTTNLLCSTGTISIWLSPDWSSTNAGGTGPGGWGRLFEAGTYTTNASIGWLSLYLSPDGSTVYFAGQTNDGSGGTYLSAPISLTNNTWNNLVLTYGPTNSWLYLNGLPLTNGSGVAWYPGPNALTNGFSIGSSAADGLSQARSIFTDFETYTYQWNSNDVYLTYLTWSTFLYGGGGGGGQATGDVLTNAPSVPLVVPTFDAVTGPGILQFVSTNTSGCVTSSSVWITNMTASPTNNQVMNITFTIAGGSNNVPYDVFATSALLSPMTNSTWVWLGQGYHCSTYSLTIQSNSAALFILGTPQDSDNDGLTDAYKLLVLHINPDDPDVSGDGMLNGWKVLWGMNPLINNPAQSGERANYTFDSTGRLESVNGIEAEIFNFDAEGNIQLDQQ